ncbi:uncharacterized protein LOC116417116 [Nasonia vitripennis]|uniref:Uncharacterized protein n=1 Tax=Nasonia vitripennis TaxID=7425 RepID=A0A7M7QA21_NASVI|nr:uncharacterized protein LOC116417116 [Nasonia vitripennis]
MRVVALNQELASMYNVAEESLRSVVLRIAGNLQANSVIRRRFTRSWCLRVKRMVACQLCREFSRLLRCCGPRKIAQLHRHIFKKCNFVRCAAEFCMQQNFAHLPVLTRLMTAFEENNALENLLADITSDEDDDNITEYTSSEYVEPTSSDEGE